MATSRGGLLFYCVKYAGDDGLVTGCEFFRDASVLTVAEPTLAECGSPGTPTRYEPQLCTAVTIVRRSLPMWPMGFERGGSRTKTSYSQSDVVRTDWTSEFSCFR